MVWALIWGGGKAGERRWDVMGTGHGCVCLWPRTKPPFNIALTSTGSDRSSLPNHAIFVQGGSVSGSEVKRKACEI